MAVTLLWMAALVLIAWAGATGRGVRDTRDPDYTLRPPAPRRYRGSDDAVIAIRRTPVEHTSTAVPD
ncbi:hypothetical protein ACIRL2_33530 [Embleya sp. NPDC127516]|uniref:hypothetical protein n=1 Tax=Embleya sp. NPDC127516 TaxID=3363990 RepID=UPI00381CEC68